MGTKFDFHLHSTGSDGKLTPEEVVNNSIKAGVKYMCFTDHYPVSEEVTSWMKGFHSEEYCAEVQRLQKKYSKKIKIAFGAEIDWLENYASWTKKEIGKKKYDFILGSVHFLKLKNGKYRQFYSLDRVNELVKEYGSIKALVHEYYSQLRKMVKSGMFDCIAHMDLIKMFNENSSLFSEEEQWYKEEVLESLEAISSSKMAIEINMSGLKKPVQLQYPSIWILKEANLRGIPITIGSDSHDHGERNLHIADKLAKEAGYNSIVIFNKRKMRKIKI